MRFQRSGFFKECKLVQRIADLVAQTANLVLADEFANIRAAPTFNFAAVVWPMRRAVEKNAINDDTKRIASAITFVTSIAAFEMACGLRFARCINPRDEKFPSPSPVRSFQALVSCGWQVREDRQQHVARKRSCRLRHRFQFPLHQDTPGDH